MGQSRSNFSDPSEDITGYTTSTSAKISEVKIGQQVFKLSQQEQDDYKKVLQKFNENDRLISMEQDVKEQAAVRLAIPKIIKETYFDIKFNQGLKVKLIIIKIDNKALREFFTPILYAVGQAPAFSMYHTAITIAGKVIDWNDSSLCIPRQWKSEKCVLAADLCRIKTQEDFNKIIGGTCEKIAEWNSSRIYSRSKNNCQTFTDELCTHLNIDLKFVGATEEYISRLRRTGKCEPLFTVSETLGKMLDIPPQTIEFKTHQELDDFCYLVIKKASMYVTSSAGEADEALLRAFDRAFWFRHKKVKDDETCKPHNCPFGDPELQSMLC
jgi:hypothetical protein